MDLAKILNGVENAPDLIKQIEAEIGREYVPRAEFNTKNAELKTAQTQLGEMHTSIEKLTNDKTAHEKTISELTDKVIGFETSALKSRIAHEMGLPYELAARLTGENEESLREDAKNFAEYIKPVQAPLPQRTNETPSGASVEASLAGMFQNFRKE